MRLIVNGQQAFGKACLEALFDRGEEIVGVYCAPEKSGQPLDPVKEYALEKGLNLVQPNNYTDASVLEEMRLLNADLMVMAFMIIFMPSEARDIPTFGSICFHPSLLPKHRGPSSINWPIIGGAKKTGLSIFWPDDGLDEGDVLLQKEVIIGPDDSLGTVYFEKIFPLGIEAVLEAVDLVKAGIPPRLKQDESQATYESWCKKEDVKIDWSKSLDEVYNLIRGANPQPGAWTIFDGNELKIFDCVKVSLSGAPGKILELADESFTVGVKGGGIQIKRVRPHNDKKISAADFISKSGLVKGTQLGS
jgi:methionyl-tRNA formyltransferase|tara:strand:- start:371 stop:1285 length:915 start_codon:yes stop_codon:yes gene_type:complete